MSDRVKVECLLVMLFCALLLEGALGARWKRESSHLSALVSLLDTVGEGVGGSDLLGRTVWANLVREVIWVANVGS